MISKNKKTDKEDAVVENSTDPKIDQDFPGFPHAPSNRKNINPKTATEKKSAGVTDKKKSDKTYGG